MESTKAEENMKIPDLRTALQYFISHKLDGKGRLMFTFQGKKGPIAHRVADLRVGKENREYYLLHNRNFLWAFGKLFKDTIPSSDSTGMAQTVHLRVLDAAAPARPPITAYIIIMMTDASTYTATAEKWVEYLLRYRTKRIIPGENEYSVSMPVRHMHEFEADEAHDEGSILSYMNGGPE